MREPAVPCPPNVFEEPAARPAVRRALAVRPRHVALQVRLDPAVRQVSGTVRHTVEARYDGVDCLPLDGVELTVTAVVDADGEALDFRQREGGLDVLPRAPLRAQVPYTFAITFEAAPEAGLYFVPADDTHSAQAWTQGAMEDHQHWFPCFDAPEHMVTTEVIADVPAGYTAISNGEPIVFEVAQGDGWTRFHWRHDTAHALYLLTLVVDELVAVEDTSHEVLQVNYLPPGHASKAEALFRRVPEMLEHLGRFAGTKYPYPRYGHVFLRSFMWGGMENTTLTSLTDAVLVSGSCVESEDVERLIAHELAHQWFGDLIAPRGWPEIWLNESFATYFEVLCMGAMNGPDDQLRRIVAERDSYFGEARDRYARAVVTRNYAHPYVLFDRHAYEKGALVLHMLRSQLGDAVFFAGVKRYVEACRGTAAETAWLRRAFEEVSGEDLTDFFEYFVYGAAHPKLSFSWQWSPSCGLEVAISRRDETAQTVPITVAVCVGGERITHRLQVPAEGRHFVLPATQRPLWVALDPHMSALIEIDESAQSDPVLRARLDPATAPAALRLRTVRLLASRGSARNTAALAQVLAADPSDATRAESAQALGAHRSHAARTALKAALDSEAPWRIRAAAARALGVGASVEEVPDLAERLATEGHYQVRAGLLTALGEIPDPSARAIIDEWLDVPSCRDRVAVAALKALAKQQDAAAIDPILARAEPGNPRSIRQAAIGCLATLAAIEGLPGEDKKRVRLAVEGYLADPLFQARYAAIAAVARLKDKASKPALVRAHGAEPFGLLRRSIREAMGRL